MTIRPNTLNGFLVLTLLISSFLPAGAQAQFVCTLEVAPDACLASPEPVSACRTKLEGGGDTLAVRMSLCEALLRQEEFSKAAVIVEGSISRCGSNRSLCRDLEIVRSNVEERLRGASLEDPTAERARVAALRGYCLGPIANERGVDACAQLLAGQPDDLEVLESLGSKLVKLGRPTEALRRYRRTERESGESAELTAMIEVAMEQRSTLVAGCLKDRDLDDCSEALLAGERDEFDLLRQRGLLLASARRYGEASLSLAEALAMKPTNKGFAREILAAIPESMGAPNAVRVRSDAYLVLGDSTRSLLGYQRVLAVLPNDDASWLGLEAARAKRKTDIERACNSERDLAGCEALLLPNEPDAELVGRYLSEIETTEGQEPGGSDTGAEVEPVEFEIADSEASETDPASDEGMSEHDAEDFGVNAVDEQSSDLSGIALNALRPDGRAH